MRSKIRLSISIRISTYDTSVPFMNDPCDIHSNSIWNKMQSCSFWCLVILLRMWERMESDDIIWVGDYLPTVYEVAQTIYHYSKKPTSHRWQTWKYCVSVWNIIEACLDWSVRRGSCNLSFSSVQKDQCCYERLRKPCTAFSQQNLSSCSK